MLPPKIVWVAVHVVETGITSPLHGVYDTEAGAVAACRQWSDWVGPVVMNEFTPDGGPWEGGYYPCAKTPGWVSDTGQVGLTPA